MAELEAARGARIRGYWAANPCGRDLVGLPDEGPAFFEKHDRILAALYPYFRDLLAWLAEGEGPVLEVGCGLGYATATLARMGRRVCAVDLTREAARLTALRLRHQGLEGWAVVADGSALPFKPGVFGGAMSLGVIHHTDHPERVVAEIHRVTRRGSRALFMLYNRFSLHTLWILGFLWPVLLFLHAAPGFLRRLAFRMRPGLKDYWLAERWPTAQDAINAGTDAYGLRNPLSRLYSRGQARRLLVPFRVLRFFAEDSYGPGRETLLHKWLLPRWGFYLYARCTA